MCPASYACGCALAWIVDRARLRPCACQDALSRTHVSSLCQQKLSRAMKNGASAVTLPAWPIVVQSDHLLPRVYRSRHRSAHNKCAQQTQPRRIVADAMSLLESVSATTDLCSTTRRAWGGGHAMYQSQDCHTAARQKVHDPMYIHASRQHPFRIGTCVPHRAPTQQDATGRAPTQQGSRSNRLDGLHNLCAPLATLA